MYWSDGEPLISFSYFLYAHPILTILGTIIIIGVVIYACGLDFKPRDRHMHFHDDDK